MWRSAVKCIGVDRNGREAYFYWEINHGYSPEHDQFRRGLFVHALTRDAGRVTPQYVPRGLLVEDLPLMPWMTARAFHSQANLNKD